MLIHYRSARNVPAQSSCQANKRMARSHLQKRTNRCRGTSACTWLCLRWASMVRGLGTLQFKNFCIRANHCCRRQRHGVWDPVWPWLFLRNCRVRSPDVRNSRSPRKPCSRDAAQRNASRASLWRLFHAVVRVAHQNRRVLLSPA